MTEQTARERIAEVVSEFGHERTMDTLRRSRGEPTLKNGNPFPATDRIVVIVYEELLKEYGLGSRGGTKDEGND